MSRKTNLLSTSLFAIAIAGSAFANAQDQNNPLHPAYFVGKRTAISTAGGAERYVDSRNPLHPAYGQQAGGDWQVTGTGSMQAYVDNHNPLHPRFVR